MEPWTFLEAMSGAESFVVKDIAALPDPVGVKLYLDLLLPRLQQMVRWSTKHAKVLDGECADLIELRFEYGNVQHRPLGYYMPRRRRTFVIVMMAREINDRWVPSDACGTAKARKKQVDETRVRVYKAGIGGLGTPPRDRRGAKGK
jgi:hypothetical protein